MSPAHLHIEYELRGIVQGVGLRPAVYRLASALGLGGSVANNGGVVALILEGQDEIVAQFFTRLPECLPTQARLDSVTEKGRSAIDESCRSLPFKILESGVDAGFEVSFPPDLRTCPECFSEVLDPADRRFGYPFTTCTQCGPRFTVITGLPYDRERTTLAKFPLCSSCRDEYRNPDGRRYHAESIACPVCGPRLLLFDADGTPRDGEPLAAARESISRGEIVAVRGIGGYLLVVDALNTAAVERLRERKARRDKPLAVAARDLETVRRFCELSQSEARALDSPEAPIVILELLEQYHGHPAFRSLTPDSRTLGVMLPTSPLQLLLFGGASPDLSRSFELLVMTSGNRNSEPICIDDREAFERLRGVADLYLSHDRDINLRADDSLVVEQSGKLQIWRKARGFAPRALVTARSAVRPVLALGAAFKNTVSVGEGSRIFSSPHIGDLDTLEARLFFEQMVETYLKFYRIRPEVVAVDLHPDLPSAVFGRQFAARRGLKLQELQHHHAHAGAVMAEKGLESALALVFDGTGYGTDGTIWGSELLYCSGAQFKRLGHFEPVPLPGGDKATLEPKRQLIGRLATAGVALPSAFRKRYQIDSSDEESWTFQARRGLNAPLSSAAGRLFDSFAAALLLAPGRITYDGQAAVRLETAANAAGRSGVELSFDERETEGRMIIDWSGAVVRLLELHEQRDADELAYACHWAVARAAARMLEYGLSLYPGVPIVLSGGCFMNKLLTYLLLAEMRRRSLHAFIAADVPPNDAGISVGQVYLAGVGDF